MITQSVVLVLVDVIGGLLAAIFRVLGAPLSGSIKIPLPLAWVVQEFFVSLTALVPALLVWWVWRQIKS